MISCFSSVKSHPSLSSVQIANGSLSEVTRVGTIKLSNDILLSNVLYVPKLSCNLMSVIKLTSDLNCISKFYSNLHEFQEFGSGKVIGIAKQHDGLYLFQGKHPSSSSFGLNCESSSNYVASSTSKSLSSETRVMLWNFCLRHPNFLYLEKMSHQLFLDKK